MNVVGGYACTRSILPITPRNTNAPKGPITPTITYTGVYENRSTTNPTSSVNSMLAMPADVPPIPNTEPTSCFGKQSEGLVWMFGRSSGDA